MGAAAQDPDLVRATHVRELAHSRCLVWSSSQCQSSHSPSVRWRWRNGCFSLRHVATTSKWGVRTDRDPVIEQAGSDSALPAAVVSAQVQAPAPKATLRDALDSSRRLRCLGRGRSCEVAGETRLWPKSVCYVVQCSARARRQHWGAVCMLCLLDGGCCAAAEGSSTAPARADVCWDVWR